MKTMSSSRPEGWMLRVDLLLSMLLRPLVGTMRKAWRAVIGNASLLLVAVVTIAVVALFAAVVSYVDKKNSNDTVTALLSGKDLKIDPQSSDENVLQARAYFHLYRDDVEAAQPIVDAGRLRASPLARAAMLYNLANARLRQAVKFVEKGNHDKAIALVRLAKDEYRESLTIDPDNWNAKYNLDFAMRLVRDFPGGAGEEEAEEDAPKKIWTDLPGIPRGLP